MQLHTRQVILPSNMCYRDFHRMAIICNDSHGASRKDGVKHTDYFMDVPEAR